MGLLNYFSRRKQARKTDAELEQSRLALAIERAKIARHNNGVNTRQVERAKFRRAVKVQGTDRKSRRLAARQIGAKTYREIHELPEPR